MVVHDPSRRFILWAFAGERVSISSGAYSKEVSDVAYCTVMFCPGTLEEGIPAPRHTVISDR
jgi:hypothetical protein